MHKKEPQEPPEHTSEDVKLQNFLEACPQTPLTQSVLWGPTFCIYPAPPPIPLCGPGSTSLLLNLVRTGMVATKYIPYFSNVALLLCSKLKHWKQCGV